MKKKFVSVVLTALMVASLATACGGSKSASTDTGASAPAAETSAPAAETKTETSAPAAETTVDTNTENAADSSESEDFTLLDVSTDMIETGVYAISEDDTELVFSMFTAPSGTPMASLFVFTADGSGDVICGTYTGDSETDEDGIDWTLLTVSDVYTGEEFEIGFGELGDEVYIIDTEDGTPYEGEYLSADDTIVYMGTAAALME